MITDLIMHSSRIRKLKQFYNCLAPLAEDKILEVGVNNKEYSDFDNFLIKKYSHADKITALGLGDISDFKKRYALVNAVGYDGREFPFKDMEFDIVHSNAVIEHVGSRDAQLLFLLEMTRVGRRGMFTTPNKYFPVEIHTRIPLLHWIPKKHFDNFLNGIGKSWATGNYMNLLGLHDIKILMGKVNVNDYKVIKNRFCGLTMTFTVIWNNKVDDLIK